MPAGKDSNGIGLICLVREIFEANRMIPGKSQVTVCPSSCILRICSREPGGWGVRISRCARSFSDTVRIQPHILDARLSTQAAHFSRDSARHFFKTALHTVSRAVSGDEAPQKPIPLELLSPEIPESNRMELSASPASPRFSTMHGARTRGELPRGHLESGAQSRG